MKTLRALSGSDRLAALAGVAAAIASIAGFVPGLYRDPKVVIAQSHGFDLGNLFAVLILGLGLTWSARGSVRGRVLLMTVFMAIDGQPLAMPLIAIFGIALALSAALAWTALRTRRQPRAEPVQTSPRERRLTS